MKCNQKLCQRNKNLDSNGTCNVCNEVIRETEKKHEKIKKNNVVEKVELDFKYMVAANKQLSKGEQVDPGVVSNLLLSGIINILAQHDTIVELEARVKILEHEKVSNAARIEALENWVLKQDDQITKVKDKLSTMDVNGAIIKENKDIDDLKMKITSVEIDMVTVKARNHGASKNQEKNMNLKKCDICSESFTRNCDLETHLDNQHEKRKELKCDLCDKTFHLKWRLKMHMKLHTEKTQLCQYFENSKDCPFEKIGCKFLHKTAYENKTCEVIEEETNEDETVSDLVGCKLCACTFLDQDELDYHMNSGHAVEG